MPTNDGRMQVLVVVAGAALILSVVLWLQREASPVSVPSNPEELEELRTGQADLIRRLDELEARLVAMQGSPPERRAVRPVTNSNLMSRLEALENQVAQSAGLQWTIQQAGQATLRGSAPELSSEEKEARIAELRAQAMDPGLRERERLKALQQLRTRGEERKGEAAVALIDMAMRSRDPKVRADVLLQMHGVKDPALIQPLLKGLASDPDEKVRRAAADWAATSRIIRACVRRWNTQ